MKLIYGLLLLSTLLPLALSLELPSPEFAQYSGYIEVNKTYNANLFYWMFESQSDPQKDPVVLWMTGGPGCSSELAVLFENGPWTVDSNLNLVNNPYSWNKRANIIFIDQPAGTGYSYANKFYVHDERQVGQEMLIFLTEFFRQYKQFAHQDFYIIGESYGGHFVPTVAYTLLKANVVPRINLRGIGLGNGWVDPYHQYASYGPFAYANKLIDTSVYQNINVTVEACQTLLRNKHYNQAAQVCSNAMGAVLNYAGNLNVYDIKLQCVPPPLCYDFTNITNYLNQEKVKKELKVKSGVEWATCNFKVNSKFTVDVEESFAWELPYILERGLTVLAYNGDLDLICNWMGGFAWTNALKWSGQDGFNRAEMKEWRVNGKPAGQFKTYDKFTFVRVYNAGHMVPHDQPENALAIEENIIYHRPFDLVDVEDTVDVNALLKVSK